MTFSDDRLYYAQREQECRKRADNASDPAIRAVHMEFARRYAEAHETLPLIEVEARERPRPPGLPSQLSS